jgi:hypothetical protein
LYTSREEERGAREEGNVTKGSLEVWRVNRRRCLTKTKCYCTEGEREGDEETEEGKG